MVSGTHSMTRITPEASCKARHASLLRILSGFALLSFERTGAAIAYVIDANFGDL